MKVNEFTTTMEDAAYYEVCEGVHIPNEVRLSFTEEYLKLLPQESVGGFLSAMQNHVITQDHVDLHPTVHSLEDEHCLLDIVLECERSVPDREKYYLVIDTLRLLPHETRDKIMSAVWYMLFHSAHDYLRAAAVLHFKKTHHPNDYNKPCIKEWLQKLYARFSEGEVLFEEDDIEPEPEFVPEQMKLPF